MAEFTALPRGCDVPARRVYATTAHFDGSALKFHIAVLRDDLHTFIVFADIPCGGVARSFTIREILIGHITQLDIVDWGRERVIFGETSWLVLRHQKSWRAVRRIVAGEPSSWLPPAIAEPILLMLEQSVPAWNGREGD